MTDMVCWARLNDDDAVLEFRDFPKDHTPPDIPHKQVRWRRFVEDPCPEHDTTLHDTVTRVVVEGDVVRRVWQVKPKPADVVAEVIRSSYRDRIVDALPDMDRIAQLARQRDEEIERLA